MAIRSPSREGRSRIPWLAIAALLLAGSLGCGSDAEHQELLVVDLNILHGIGDEGPDIPYERMPERIELIAEALAELQPDIVFLQEVLMSGDVGYPDVQSILLSALGEDYTAIFGDITGLPVNEGALGQMTLTRLPVISAENRNIGGPRSLHRVTVETDFGPLDLYNTHLEGTGAIFDVSEDAPLKELENVLAFIQATETGPAILAGDFNAEPDDPSMLALRDAGFVDALAAAGDATCAVAGDPGCTSSTRPLSDNAENRARRRIDYIWLLPGTKRDVTVERAALFLNEHLKPADGGLLWASDHIGVRALLRLE